MSSAEKFVDILEEKDLLPPGMIEKVRAQVTESEQVVSAAKVAKALINAGHLTPALAKRLLAAAEEAVKAAPSSAAEAAQDDDLGLAPLEGEKKPAKPAKPAEEDDLGLAPLDEKKRPEKAEGEALSALDDEKPRASEPALADTTIYKDTEADVSKAKEDDLGLAPLGGKKAASKGKKAEDLGLAPLDKKTKPVAKKPTPQKEKSQQKAQPQKKAQPQQKPQEKQPKQPQAAQAASGTSLLDEELPDLDGATSLGPLDGLMSDSELSAAAAGGSGILAPVKKKPKGIWALLTGLLKKKKKRKPGKKENVWDSSLLLIGGGALLFLVIAFGALWWAVHRGSGDDALGQIVEAYRAGSWTQVISNVEQYLKKFPNHNGVSSARVLRGVAQMRQRGPSDPGNALLLAKEVLTEITPEKEFPGSAADVGDVLLAIAENLAKDAHEDTDPKLVSDAHETVSLLEKVVPPQYRQQTRLNEIKASLAETEHDIDRVNALRKAVADIRAAVKGGDTDKAYEIRTILLRQFPRLADNEELIKAVETISQALQTSVELVAEEVPAEKSFPPSLISTTVSLAQTVSKAKVPNVEGQTVFALVDGVAHGLDAATGRLLWRRFLGTGTTARGVPFPPTPLSHLPGSDVLLVDPVRNEVLRIEAKTGRLRWRHPMGGPFDAHPVVVGDDILIAMPSGRLVIIDAASGESSRYVQLPQALHVAPGVDSGRELVFQPAEQLNLFVLSLDGSCQQVVYLEHERGTITTPPVVAGSYLILAVNDLAEDSNLHVLSIGQGGPGTPLCRKLQKIRLKGHVDVAPLVAGRTVLVTTDLGAIYVFDLGGGDPGAPLQKVADKTSTTRKTNLTRYAMMKSGHFWLADIELTKYAILTSRRRLALKWTIDEHNVFLQAPVAVGNATFQVRRRVGMPGAIVSAVAMEEPSVYWETRIATPLAAEPIVSAEGSTVTAVTRLSSLFRFSAASLRGQMVANRPTVELPPAQVLHPFTEVVQLPDGLLAISAGKGSKEVPVFDPQLTGRFHHVVLPEVMACHPIAFGTGLLVPSGPGQVFVVDPKTGQDLCEPFVPRVGGDTQLAWLRPARVSKDQAIATDGRSKLYRLGVRRDPKPYLTALEEGDLTEPIVTRAAVLGNVAYMVDKAGMLTGFGAATLVPSLQRPLAGHVVWGPQRLGNYVLFSTDDEKLFCLDEKKVLWEIPLTYGRLAGVPLSSGNSFTLTARGGVVWTVDAAEGRELGKIDAGCPLATGPVLSGEKLIVGGHDGSLYEVKQPVAEQPVAEQPAAKQP